MTLTIVVTKPPGAVMVLPLQLPPSSVAPCKASLDEGFKLTEQLNAKELLAEIKVRLIMIVNNIKTKSFTLIILLID